MWSSADIPLESVDPSGSEMSTSSQRGVQLTARLAPSRPTSRVQLGALTR